MSLDESAEALVEFEKSCPKEIMPIPRPGPEYEDLPLHIHDQFLIRVYDPPIPLFSLFMAAEATRIRAYGITDGVEGEKWAFRAFYL